MKAAIIVLADPAGGEDAVGRVFNALASANDFHLRGQEAIVLFQGAGTRWPETIGDPEHPVHGLFEQTRPLVRGASGACSTVFGARAGVEKAGVAFVGGNSIEGVGELPSLAGLVADGYTVLTF
ncbi:MAG: DsrE family protein [Acidimicrobiia bacterium]